MNSIMNDIMEAVSEETAYHASRANFDKFDFKHMGSGSGAQVWAYGAYLSMTPDGLEYYGDKLYTVDIPDDTGNYIRSWEELDGRSRKNYERELFQYLKKTDPETYGDRSIERDLMIDLDSAFSPGMDGTSLYGTVSSYLGSDEEASKFFYGLGVIGFRYKDGENYNVVMFNPEDITILSRNDMGE